MNLYKIEITSWPAMGKKIYVREYQLHDGPYRQNEVSTHLLDPNLRKEWEETELAKPAENYSFYMPSEDKLYRSRSTARAKQRAVERWGGKARILVAEVGPWEYVEDAALRRKDQRDPARADRLREEALAIESRVAVRSI